MSQVPPPPQQQPMPPQQPMYGQPPMQGQKKGLAIASLVVSLVGLLCFGVILGPLAIIFGAIALSKANSEPHMYGGKGMAVAGLIIGIVDIIGWVIYMFIRFG